METILPFEFKRQMFCCLDGAPHVIEDMHTSGTARPGTNSTPAAPPHNRPPHRPRFRRKRARDRGPAGNPPA